MDYSYAVHLERDEGEIGLIFPDFPEIVSWHRESEVEEQDLRRLAKDALLVALHARVLDNDEIPASTKVTGADFFVSVPALAVLKLALYEELRAEGLTKRDLARRMGKTDTIAVRLLDLTHNSAVPQLEGAMSALGREFVISAKTKPLADNHV